MYPPLEICKMYTLDNINDDVPEKKYLLRMLQGDTALIADFYYNSKFLTARYDGPYTELNEIIRSKWESLYEWASGGYKPEKKILNRPNRSLIRDAYMGLISMSKWARCKKVYQFDAELELELADVEEVRVPVRILDTLPYNTFYLQFDPNGIFASNFHGCLVDITPYLDGYMFILMRITSDLRTMAGAGLFHIEDAETENGNEPVFVVDSVDLEADHDNDPFGLRNDWEEFCFFVLNAILYLCASNADIVESKETKSTYKPNATNKCRWNEVQKFDCGYVYGQAIRYEQSLKEKTEKEIIVRDINTNTKERKRPRPHPVKASWQHYWVGSGENKQRILKFKAPYFQGGKSEFATIQKII